MLSARYRIALLGAVGGLVGLMALYGARADELLPANRVLLVIVCALLTVWLLLCVTDPWWRRL